MAKNFYIADTHFGHANIIKFDGRPFASKEEMEARLIQNWNEVVSPGDTVYILGDFCWSAKESEWERILKSLAGNKVLIRGNHDIKNMSPKLRKLFADVKGYKEITDGGRHVIMSHYPMMFYRGAYDPKTYMLCGHVHTTREDQLLENWREILIRTADVSKTYSRGHIVNVGCMKSYMGYTPRTLDEIVGEVDGRS